VPIDAVSLAAARILTDAMSSSVHDVVADWVKNRQRAGEDVPPEVGEALEEAAGRTRSSQWPLHTDRSQAAEGRSAELGVAAISIDVDSVMRDARQRVARMLRINIALAVVLAGILVIGLGGVVIAGVILGKGTAAAVFGGMSVADVFALAFTKPFALISGAVVAGQRLEVVHLRLRQELEGCNAFEDADRRLRCRRQVWQDVQAELRSLAK
jgi:hypothetical protein